MLYDLKVIDEVRDIMVSMKKTVAVAESVTAGHLQAAFSAATEASLFFQGGITAYNLGQKCRHLNIEPILAGATDCVSQSIACDMALAASKLFCSEYGISITGYAKTVPEKGLNEIFAFYAISRDGKILHAEKLSSAKPEGVDVQIDYAAQVMGNFLRLLK